MRGRYDPIKRFATFRKTNWRYSQKHTSEEMEEDRRRVVTQERQMQFDLRGRIVIGNEWHELVTPD